MSAEFSVEPPYFGAAYYPEDWPLEQIDDDVALMEAAGMNVMRMAEFAWHRMEPREGEYDFGWLHLAVDKLGAAGIASVLGTPSATPPAWLLHKHPEVRFVSSAGRPVGHGGRRHTCPNNPVYREYCARITERMAREFATDPRVIGWQIDNEVFPHYDRTAPRFGFHRACCCPVCVRLFHDFLRSRFGAIDELNRAWCLELWSQAYDSFDQVPAPDPEVWHHPSLLSAWDEFSSRSYVEFVAAQARILHRHTDRPVGTDMMPFLDVDHYDMGRELDVVQFNHYNFFEGLRDCTLFFDYFRRVQERPFWNTETSTCWGGGTALSGYCAPGFCRANSWLPIALGGEANLYWLWRTHWAGQELTFGSVVTSQGRPRHVFAEVQEIAAGFRAAAPFLNGSSPVTTGLALHMSQGSHLHFKNQSMVHGFDYVHELRTRFYTPLVKAQYRPDVIDPSTPLDGYRVILSPFLPCLDEDGLRERLRAWIEAGGVWIAGPFTDIRTAEGTQFLDAPFGSLEDWGGVYCRHQMPGFPHAFQVRADQGDPWSAEVWCDGFELRGAEALAGYSEHELAGLAAVTSRAMGRGRVILLGTVLPEPVLLGLIERVAEPEGVVSVVDADPNLVCVPREGVAGRGLVAVEVENRPAMLCLPSPGTELLSGRRVDGALEIPAYGVVVVQYDQ